MKNLKKPTYLQKQRISRAGLDAKRLFIKSDDGTTLVVIDRDTDKIFEIRGKKYTEVENQ